MRGNKLKIGEASFKKYLKDKLVDENGNKVSVRKIIENEQFQIYTGMVREDGSPISVGTFSYYTKKYKLNERVLWEYHTNITKRIKNTPYLEWSNKRNKGKCKVDNNFSRDKIEAKFINYFKEILPKNYREYKFSALKKYVINVYDLEYGKGEGIKEIEDFEEAYKNEVI